LTVGLHAPARRSALSKDLAGLSMLISLVS
jgi:hypothetical protein